MPSLPEGQACALVALLRYRSRSPEGDQFDHTGRKVLEIRPKGVTRGRITGAITLTHAFQHIGIVESPGPGVSRSLNQKSRHESSGMVASARPRARSQRSRRVWCSSAEMDGSTTLRGVHVRAMSCSSFHRPTAIPAR